MSFFIEPDGGSFMGVYMSDLPDPDDDEYKHRLAEEVRRIRSDYLGPYLERGKKISIRQIDFTSANYEGEGLAPIKQEPGCIIVLCEDDSSDADNRMRLYKNDDEDEYDEAEDYNDEENEEDEEETEGAVEKSDAGRNFEITDGVLKKYTGSDANVTIPKGVTEIGSSAFSRCKSLASVSIPGSVTEIGYNAFNGCTSLAEIHYAGSKEQWYAVKKGKDWKEDVPAKDVLVRKA